MGQKRQGPRKLHLGRRSRGVNGRAPRKSQEACNESQSHAKR